jgi:hypothetical protein
LALRPWLWRTIARIAQRAIHWVRYGRFEHDMSLFLDLSHSAGNSGPVRGSRCTTLGHQGA